MALFFIVFLAGALFGSGVTFFLLRRLRHSHKSGQTTRAATQPQAAISPATEAPDNPKINELDAQRRAATAHIQAQREAARAQREATRLAAEAAAQREAERQAAEAAAQREVEERIAAEKAQLPVASKPDKTPQETVVMVVDDSKVGRIKTNRFIQSQQFKTVTAEDGRDAVQKIAANMPDIVVTDVEMPEMDGFELTESIRSNPATAHIPIIIISGNNDGYADRAKSVGADLILGKPYSETDMVDHLHRFMRNGR